MLSAPMAISFDVLSPSRLQRADRARAIAAHVEVEVPPRVPLAIERRGQGPEQLRLPRGRRDHALARGLRRRAARWTGDPDGFDGHAVRAVAVHDLEVNRVRAVLENVVVRGVQRRGYARCGRGTSGGGLLDDSAP